uniref:C-type lectin domain-containing protein n=1 Tax=Paramormyrops kingsleyae TaxID=1676925 RepID=A0A3B3TD16_9TELE
MLFTSLPFIITVEYFAFICFPQLLKMEGFISFPTVIIPFFDFSKIKEMKPCCFANSCSSPFSHYNTCCFFFCCRKSEGGDLASIHSNEEWKLFNDVSNKGILWIGLYYDESTNLWTWSNGDSSTYCSNKSTCCSLPPAVHPLLLLALEVSAASLFPQEN